MDRIKLLQSRRADLLSATKSIRKKIEELVDCKSFVELDSYSFSHSDVYEQDAFGEGVVTGIGTINNRNYCIIAINPEIMHGGLSLGSCNKIAKCMERALRSSYSVIYLLESNGVQCGEGVNVLEGIAKILTLSSVIKNSDGLSQYALICGNLFGSLSVLADNCDFVFSLKDGKVSFASPLVISAKNPNANSEYITEKVNSVGEFRDKVISISHILEGFSEEETDDNPNRNCPELNQVLNDENLIKAVFDKNSFIELNKDFASEVKTGFAYLDSLSVATIVFNSENTVELNTKNLKKITDFIKLVQKQHLPLITFVNAKGISFDVNCQKCVLSKINEFIGIYKDINKISVITGNAIGLGYTLFASKKLNTSYSFAFANANMGLFDEKTGAIVELDAECEKINELAEKYKDKLDPVNTAHNGYLDNIIEPQYVRQYLIVALQTLEV